MSDDSAHKPNKSYPVSVKPPEGSVFVPNTAKLVQGARLHACYKDDWHPLTTISENADGTVNVTWDKYGRSYDCAMIRGELIITNSLLASLEKHPANKYPVTKPNIVAAKEPPAPLSKTALRRKSYKVTIAVPSDSQRVPKDLQLKEGIALRACYGGSWHPLTALGQNDDGSVNVRWDEYGSGFDCSMMRDELIISNDVAEQLRSNPDYKPEVKPLKRKSYPISIAIPSDSVLVPPDAKIAKGMKLQACWAGKWNPITAISEANDGSLNVHWDAFSDGFDCSMLRTELIIKKSVLRAAATASSSGPMMRTWIDSTGQHKIRAKLLSKSATEVTLEREDGQQVTLPIAKLSPADQRLLRGEAPKTANPFAP